MATYVGRARFTDDGGASHDVEVELEQVSNGEWAGVIAGALDWTALIGAPELRLRLPERSGFPTLSSVRVNLTVDDRAIVSGVGCAESPQLETAGKPRRRRQRRQPAIRWHNAL